MLLNALLVLIVLVNGLHAAKPRPAPKHEWKPLAPASTQLDDDVDSQDITTTTISKLQNGEFGADFRPGFMMDTNTMLYGRIGVAFNRATLKTSNTFVFNNLGDSITYVSPFYKTKNHNAPALRLGIGLERHVSDSISITADYIYTYYGNVKTSVGGDTTSIMSGEDDNAVATTNINGFVANTKSTIKADCSFIDQSALNRVSNFGNAEGHIH